MASGNKNKKWVQHYRENCIGCGNCELVCPKYWEMNPEDGKATLKDSEKKKGEIYQRKLDIEDTEENDLASQLCPVGIIKIT